MLKGLFSKFFFNSTSNSGNFPSENTTQEQNKGKQTHEEKLSNWLAHPNEYGRKPIYTKVIESGEYQISFFPEKIKYSLIEYQMGKGDKKEIAMVDSFSTWSFLNMVDYKKIDKQKLKIAYFGKLSQNMHLMLQHMGIKPKETINIKEEKERIKRLFASNDSLRVIDIFKVDQEITYFLLEVQEKNNIKVYMPGLANQKEYDVEEFFREDDPMAPLGMYYEMGKCLTRIHPG